MNGAVPWVMEVSAESSKTVLMKSWRWHPHGREQRDRVPVRRDQDRGEPGIRDGRDAERDGDVGDLERVVRLTVSVESSVPGRRRSSRRGSPGRPRWS